MRVQIERLRVQIERPNRSNPRETKTRLSNGFIVPITPTGSLSDSASRADGGQHGQNVHFVYSKVFSNMGRNEDFVRARVICAFG